MITSSNYFISETSADHIYELARCYEPCKERFFLCHGHIVKDMESYIVKHIRIEKYLDDVKQIFELEEANSSNKINA